MECKIIKIKCLLCNNIDIYKYEIFIYDIDGNIVYNGKKMIRDIFFLKYHI